MPTIATFVKNPPVRFPKLRAATDSHCVHCYQPLNSASAGQIHANQVERHECEESLLAKQPATPVPFN